MNTRLVLSVLVATVVSLMLGGCGGSRTVQGRVVTGKAGVVTLVDVGDARLEAAGVDGVLVRIMRPGATVAMAEATTTGGGSFSMKLTEDQALAGRVEVEARGASVLTSRGSVYVPDEGRRVLIYVEPRRGSEDGAR